LGLVVAGTADDIGRDLVAWAGSVLPKTQAAAKPLGARERVPGVDIRLLGLAPKAQPRTHNPPDIVDLDFLVTVQLADAYEEERALAELLLAAAERSDFEIVAGRTAAELCATLGIPVAAGFVVRTPLARERERRRAPLVRFPLIVEAADLTVLEGIVTGPGDVPIAGAHVTVKGLDKDARTDRDGRFVIRGVPREKDGLALNVKARGVELDAPAVPGQTVVLHLPLEV
jgi:carboxypeptidase family protein